MGPSDETKSDLDASSFQVLDYYHQEEATLLTPSLTRTGVRKTELAFGKRAGSRFFYVLEEGWRITKEWRINDEIRAKDVRLVSPEGEQLGIMQVRDALRIAAERNMDLVEVASGAKPPVCKIMDFGRFKYEQQKQDKEARKKQKLVNIKEVKLRPRIEAHDFEVKAKNAFKFLTEGDKVKATIQFRGREIVHPDLGKAVLDRLAVFLQEVAIIERAARVEGRNMIMFLTPKNPS